MHGSERRRVKATNKFIALFMFLFFNNNNNNNNNAWKWKWKLSEKRKRKKSKIILSYYLEFLFRWNWWCLDLVLVPIWILFFFLVQVVNYYINGSNSKCKYSDAKCKTRRHFPYFQLIDTKWFMQPFSLYILYIHKYSFPNMTSPIYDGCIIFSQIKHHFAFSLYFSCLYIV